MAAALPPPSAAVARVGTQLHLLGLGGGHTENPSAPPLENQTNTRARLFSIRSMRYAAFVETEQRTSNVEYEARGVVRASQHGRADAEKIKSASFGKSLGGADGMWLRSTATRASQAPRDETDGLASIRCSRMPVGGNSTSSWLGRLTA